MLPWELWACDRATGQTTGQPATAGKAQAEAPAIVQAGAPGQASTVVSKVPAFHDNNCTDADVKFMQGMIHHHHQALLMAAMIRTPTASPELIAMGQKIQLSQSGEIQAMKEWLTARKQSAPMIKFLSQNEIDAAKLATREGCGAPNDLSVQCQPHYVWPASFVVARAYLDQLARDKALPQERIDALNAAMKDVENASAANRKAAATRLDGLAAELAKDAATAMGNTAARMRACASTIQKRNAQLR